MTQWKLHLQGASKAVVSLVTRLSLGVLAVVLSALLWWRPMHSMKDFQRQRLRSDKVPAKALAETAQQGISLAQINTAGPLGRPSNDMSAEQAIL